MLALAGMASGTSDRFAASLDRPETIELPDATLTRQDVLLGSGVLLLSLLLLIPGYSG